MSNAIIITAAGKGTRFGDPRGKIFTEIQGKPMILHTYESLFKHVSFSELIITIEKERIEDLKLILSVLPYDERVTIIPGGETRFESVRNAFFAIRTNPTRIWIHDGARPFISSELLTRMETDSQRFPCVIPGIPVVDTIKIADDHMMVTQTPARKYLYQIQTPQIFQTEILRSAYKKMDGNFEAITDEAFLVEKAGYAIKIIPGDPRNIKITYQNDIKIFTLPT